MCANLDELDEPEAKASLIWIIGEYANKIDNADELLGIFVDSFTEESYAVRPYSTLLMRTLTTHVRAELGAITNANGSGETVPKKAGLVTGRRPARAQHCDERLRLP